MSRDKPRWRAAVAGMAVVAAGWIAGCGSRGLAPLAGLAAVSARAHGSLDGFVFVPQRQRAGAALTTSIPHAQITVTALPAAPGQAPLATTQADAAGRYRLDDLPLFQALVIHAVDPFDSRRQLRAMVSFQVDGQVKTRNLDPPSTVAAGVVLASGFDRPVSDSQFEALESIASEKLGEVTGDVTLDEDALRAVILQAEATSFGTLVVRVYSSPPVSTLVDLNGGELTTILSSLPPGARQTVAAHGNEVTVATVPVGIAELELDAPGFLVDESDVEILAGQTTTVERTLVPHPGAGVNLLPVIVSAAVTPSALPRGGGALAVRCVVRDPEDDSVTGRVELRAGPLGAVLAAADCVRQDDVYTASLTAPPATADVQGWVVVAAFRDGPSRPEVRRDLPVALTTTAPRARR